MKKSRFPLRHIVDDEARVIYVGIDGTISAIGVPILAKQFYPGYKAEIVSKERFISMHANP